jgi:hypothetical protein
MPTAPNPQGRDGLCRLCMGEWPKPESYPVLRFLRPVWRWAANSRRAGARGLTGLHLAQFDGEVVLLRRPYQKQELGRAVDRLPPGA